MQKQYRIPQFKFFSDAVDGCVCFGSNIHLTAGAIDIEANETISLGIMGGTILLKAVIDIEIINRKIAIKYEFDDTKGGEYDTLLDRQSYAEQRYWGIDMTSIIENV